MTTFRLPDLGEGLHEAEIVAWHVTVGQHVVKDEPLVSVETDKAVVEIPSPLSGRVVRTHGKPGDHLAVGASLVEFDEAVADAGAIVGDIGPTPTREAIQPMLVTHGALGAAPPHGAARLARTKAAPAVRALAAELGVDLASLAPSGAAGQITREDVERAASAVRPAVVEGYEPLHGVRRAMARNMARSGAEVVPATVTEEADVDAWSQDADVTARLVRALAAAARAEPSLNAWYDGRTLARKIHGSVHVGIATDTKDGLIVPVLRDAGDRDLAALRGELEALKAAARGRTAPPDMLRGATITLSNFGALGAGRFAMLAIVPPQVAILGAGRITPQLVPIDAEPTVRRRLPLSLTFDHRAVSGGEAARFLAADLADLEKPA